MTSIFNTIESGGAAIYVRRLVQELAKNHEVFVITALSGRAISNKNETNPKLIQLDSKTQIRILKKQGFTIEETVNLTGLTVDVVKKERGKIK